MTQNLVLKRFLLEVNTNVVLHFVNMTEIKTYKKNNQEKHKVLQFTQLVINKNFTQVNAAVHFPTKHMTTECLLEARLCS